MKNFKIDSIKLLIKKIPFLIILATLVSGSFSCQAEKRGDEDKRPNFIIIFTDDQGYNDLGCFGSKLIKTPRIDKMAEEGVRMTNFYSAAPLCGPSRAALLTGCYSQRVAEPGPPVGRKRFHTVLHANEITIADVLKSAGYSTMAIGKWHVSGNFKTNGEKLEDFKIRDEKFNSMPKQKGFDSYFGHLSSNDQLPFIIMEDNQFIEFPAEQKGITTRYTDVALDFIQQNHEKPFFLYLAHHMPHTPLYPSGKFEGTSAGGFYGDCIEEIDWNTGRVLDKLKELNIDENTFVIFTSDNGPWQNPENARTPDNKTSRLQAGNASPLRGFKMTSWEGGSRVPCVVRWPAGIQAGQTIKELATTMDLMPTFAALAGTQEPQDRIIDGKNIFPLLSGETKKSPHNAYFYYKQKHLHAVRKQEWKLVLPHKAKDKSLGWYSNLQEEVNEDLLFNLNEDIGETNNLAHKYPEKVVELKKLLEEVREDLGDREREGTNVRIYE
jgi:arylsulfatase A-like enzyme